MNSNKEFPNNFGAYISKVKRDILQTINKKNSVGSVTRIDCRNLKSQLFDVSENVACDYKHMSSYTYDNLDSEISAGKNNNYTQSVIYLNGLSGTLSCEERKFSFMHHFAASSQFRGKFDPFW